MAIVGGLLLVLPGRVSGVVGFVLIIAACPLLVAFGVPIAAGISTLAIGITASLVAWFAIGQWAAIRATQRPIADWRDRACWLEADDHDLRAFTMADDGRIVPDARHA